MNGLIVDEIKVIVHDMKSGTEAEDLKEQSCLNIAHTDCHSRGYQDF